jgi:hypothetical protein
MINTILATALSREDVVRFREALEADLGAPTGYTDQEISEMAVNTIDAIAALAVFVQPTPPPFDNTCAKA